MIVFVKRNENEGISIEYMTNSAMGNWVTLITTYNGKNSKFHTKSHKECHLVVQS